MAKGPGQSNWNFSTFPIYLLTRFDQKNLILLVPVRFYGPPQWHMSRQHLSWLNFCIYGLSQLLLTWFWPNFKGRFLGQSLTDANCCGDICPGNNFFGNICHFRKVYLFGPKISRFKFFVDSKFVESKMW